MNDESPFAAFETSMPGPPAAEPKKRGRKPKAVASGIAAQPQPAAEPKKRGRKPKVDTGQQQAIKIDLGLALRTMSGLQEADAAILFKYAGVLQTLPKKQRHRIIKALGDIFA